jgi:hypothetical protein
VSTVATTVGRFVWHEQVSSDPKQAQEFYTRLFGWGTEVFKPGEVDYTMISSGGQNHGGFGKAMEGAPPPHWLGHIRVEYLEETIAKVKSAGGKLAAGPFEMSKVGRIAIVTDPQGAFVSIYQPEDEVPGAEASSSGTSSGRPTSAGRSASTARSSAGRRATWGRSTAATGSSSAGRRASAG